MFCRPGDVAQLSGKPAFFAASLKSATCSGEPGLYCFWFGTDDGPSGDVDAAALEGSLLFVGAVLFDGSALAAASVAGVCCALARLATSPCRSAMRSVIFTPASLAFFTAPPQSPPPSL